jgi:hypothetical protein
VPDFFRTMWSHFHLEPSNTSIAQRIVDGASVAFGAFRHVANTTNRRFATPARVHLTSKDGAIAALLYEDTYAVAKAFGV